MVAPMSDQMVAPMSDQTENEADTGVPGLDLTVGDPQVSPRDDFYRSCNGSWLTNFQIPDDKSEYGGFTALHDQAQEQLRAIVEELTDQVLKSPVGQAGEVSEAGKIAALFSDFMDTSEVERVGIAALTDLLARVDSCQQASQLLEIFGHFDRIGIGAPLQSHVHQDNHDSTRYLLDLWQSGLGLPDRDYYLEDRHASTLRAYRVHIERMWELAGFEPVAEPPEAANTVLEIETAMARIQWDVVRNRDPHETYNVMSIDQVKRAESGAGLLSFLRVIGAAERVSEINLGQPDYWTGLSELIGEVPVDRWRIWLRWRVLTAMAPLLTPDLDEANFAFFGTVLRGTPRQRPRWKRGIDLVQSAMGEALGRVYVERHFPPDHKARMLELVENLLAAFAAAIDQLDWMSPETRKRAQEKLSTFRAKIGYPDKWRDYSALDIRPGDLVGNVLRACAFEHDRDINKLGEPIDRDEWFMPPQMVNAYYNPEMNEIVFPAAILQPPFFNADADDAINYGAIGAVIGHEISHGFDDKGSQYDGEGNLNDWWTLADREAFADRTQALIAQYAEYEPVAGHPLNGELTLGENIADISGLAVAFQAYQRSPGGSVSLVIGGMTGEERFFRSYSQVWRTKTREEETVRRIAIDPHSPPEYRVNGVLINSDDFVRVMKVQAGDDMWREPGERIRIW